MSRRATSGIHHVTAIAGDPQRNLDFYVEVLGLRLVKLTVNFDDPGTYHFYFGDGAGTPGSILTFFPWPGASRGRVGVGQVSAVSFAVPAVSLDWWVARLGEERVPAEEVGSRFGERVVRLADPDGTPLELVGTARGASPGSSTDRVPPQHAIGGFHGATLASADPGRTGALLRDGMGLRHVGTEGDRSRFQAPPGEPGVVVDVASRPGGAVGTLGAGTVHHIAFRTPDDAQQGVWREELVRDGYDVTPVRDRRYFHSIYFREPGGVLFEIATDAPGFALDEPRERLGERLMLPPWLEPRRTAIERALPPIELPRGGTTSGAVAGGGAEEARPR
jgi:glyoxalase family protein